MSREIKFRAWDAANSRMEYDQFYVHQKTGLCHYFGDSIGVGSNPEFYDCGEEEPVLMQFTGLKDKNGKEIYEGDIILSKGYIEAPYVVTWHKIGFGVRYIKNEEAIFVTDSAWQAMEIIGNIYQNPDLTTQ